MLATLFYLRVISIVKLNNPSEFIILVFRKTNASSINRATIWLSLICNRKFTKLHTEVNKS